ncbi:MAG TPA: hypothetical protein VHU23_13235 [Rhizomicrobium sp.]|jgi:hypothetical protein|nr:hypothetical protein [Rhizomicrobium sp.]
MTPEEEKAARAREIEDAVKKADAKKRTDAEELEARRNADNDMGTKLDKVLTHLDDVGKRMDAIEARFTEGKETSGHSTPLADEDEGDGLTGLTGQDLLDAKNKQTSALIDAQARCDSVAQAFGQSAPRFMAGETTMGYRRRLLRPFQGYSEKFKGVDITMVKDPATFAAIENVVYADALAASSNPIVEEGRLEARTVSDASGRKITSFFGEPRTWMRAFSGHTMALTGFNKDFTRPQ